MDTNSQHLHELEVIEVAPDATLGALLARLDIATGPVVALAFADADIPLALTETLPWMAMQRKAAQRRLRLVVVAPRAKDARRMGEQAGIPAARSLDDAARVRHGGTVAGAYPMGMPEFWDGQRRAATVQQARRRFRLTRPVGKPPERGVRVAPWLTNLALFFWLVAMTAVLGLTIIGLVPSATVALVPERQPIRLSVPISADLTTTRTDFTQQAVPARSVVLDVEATGEWVPTGTRQEPDATAVGMVLFTNRRAQGVTIPAGTIVATSSGTNLRFQTVQDVALPPGVGATVRVGIEALSPGPMGNVRAFAINTIQGSLNLVAQVVNEAPTDGGTFREASVVTQADKDNLLLTTERQVLDEANRRLGELLNEGEFIPQETMTTLRLSENFNHAVDDPADLLTVHLRVRVRGLAVDGDAARLIAQNRLEDLVPADGALLTSGLSIEPGAVTSASAEQVQFAMEAAAQYTRPLPVDEIRRALSGQPVAAAQARLLERYALDAVQGIVVSPAWYAETFRQMPLLPARIYVQVDYAPEGAPEGVP